MSRALRCAPILKYVWKLRQLPLYGVWNIPNSFIWRIPFFLYLGTHKLNSIVNPVLPVSQWLWLGIFFGGEMKLRAALKWQSPMRISHARV